MQLYCSFHLWLEYVIISISSIFLTLIVFVINFIFLNQDFLPDIHSVECADWSVGAVDALLQQVPGLMQHAAPSTGQQYSDAIWFLRAQILPFAPLSGLPISSILLLLFGFSAIFLYIHRWYLNDVQICTLYNFLNIYVIMTLYNIKFWHTDWIWLWNSQGTLYDALRSEIT